MLPLIAKATLNFAAAIISHRDMIEWLSQPGPWYVAGPLIALTMVLLLFFGGAFGVSSNLRSICSIAGAGRYSDFFRFNWRAQIWNLMFILGGVIGGIISHLYLMTDEPIQLSASTVAALDEMGFTAPGKGMLPQEIFSTDMLGNATGFLLLIGGGFLVGFGTRYAGGCTSGHAISGLSNLQLPSLIAVVGFFLGGLVMTHLFIPILF